MFKAYTFLNEAWRHTTGTNRLNAVQREAPRLRDAIMESGLVQKVRTFDIALFPYPTKFAFQGACSLPLPYAYLTNRAVYVEYLDHTQKLRRILINPSAPEGARKAQYFQELLSKVPSWAERFVGHQYQALHEQLLSAEISPSSIDFITYDHLHVQEVGPLLGPQGTYPNAKLLVTSTERRAVRDLHPLQNYWYVSSVLEGVPEDRIIEFDQDLCLGEGLALIRTPGHTEGNHSICLHTPHALYTISENGVCADAYRPELSLIPGLSQFSRERELPVILNSNTQERSLDQFTSMRLESLLARSNDPEGFPNHFSSSELTPFYLAPLLEPTHAVTAINYQ